jgi:hypothetical protein
MKIYDLDHLETISEDVNVIRGGVVYVNASISESRSISVNPLSLSNYNRGNLVSSSIGIGAGNTVSSSTGIVAAFAKRGFNWGKSLSFTPSAVKEIAKLVTRASLILKSLVPPCGIGNS